MFAKAFAGALVLAAFANAQTITTGTVASMAATTTIAQAMPPSATAGFNAALVNDTVRLEWCAGQLHTCPQICGGITSQNGCFTSTLTYTCVCANGTAPDVTAFEQTLPYFICLETFAQCNNNNPNNLQGQMQCTANEQCGTRNATAEALAVTSAASAASASRTASKSGSSSASAASTSASATHNAAAYRDVGTGAFVAVLMAAARLAL